LLVAALAASMLCACPDRDPLLNQGGHAPADAGVTCPAGPVAMYNLMIHAAGGPVPLDLTLVVIWSAGAEPPFLLADPSTWGSLDQGANVVCDVDPQGAPPVDLAALSCHLWTSGPTYVAVAAKGYATYAGTLTPHQDPACDAPLPATIEVLLTPLGDGGPPLP